ncbi:MAG: protein kinase [Acidobacteriota bacterium]
MIGRLLGSYRVLSKVGEGGMGEVYRARDSKLNRDVAIKILPEAFAADPERRARFAREAQVLAALNHPHIAAIYAVEEGGMPAPLSAAGPAGPSAQTPFLVMELVEGPTLDARIAGRPVPIPEALAIAAQIADALDAAHEKGIVHRDLKPANIKVRDDGTVKVLDFGLAKALGAEGASATADAINSPTMTAMASRMGVILGTAAYMSPEQARGRAVDKRTDIWAFGCVLYEMLTGQRAFPGEDVAEFIAAVLTREPDWIRLPAAMPPRIVDLLRRCLKKDPRERLRDIGDARAEIAEALAGPGAPNGPSPTAVPASSSHAASRRRPIVVAGILALAAGVALGAGAVLLSRPRAEVPSSVRSAMLLPSAAPMLRGSTPSLAISRDGRRLVYAAQEGPSTALFVRDLDGRVATRVAGSDGGHLPFFSPDGTWVGFCTEDGRLLKLPVVGGNPTLLAPATDVRGASWGDDGWIVFARDVAGGLYRVRETGGAVEPLTTPEWTSGEKTHRYPDVLPGAGAIIYTIGAADLVSYAGSRVVVRVVKTGETRTLISGGMCARYVAPGFLVYARTGSLWAVAFDVERLIVSGDPVEILPDLATRAGYAVGHFAVSRNGVLIYAAGGEQPIERRVVRVDRRGRPEPLISEKGGYIEAVLSPDGRYVAFTPESANDAIWSYDTSRGTSARLTRDWNCGSPAWSPDGLRLFFKCNKERDYSHMFTMKSDRGQLEPLLDQRIQSVDGQVRGDTLAFSTWDPATKEDLWLLSVASRRVRVWLKSQFSEGAPALSPDGRWLAYASDESGRWEVYVAPIDDRDRRVQISSGGGHQVRWHPNGRELFYTNGTRLMSVTVQGAPAGVRPGQPALVFEGGPYYVELGGGPVFTVAPDGNHFVMIEDPPAAAPATDLNLVTNWTTELRRKLGVK